MNTQLSSKSGESKPRKWEGKWLLRPSERAYSKTRMIIELDIWEIRPVFYLLIAVLKSQGVPDQRHLPVYERRLKKRKKPWKKSVFASNPKPLRNNTFPLWSCSCSVCALFFFFFFLLHNAPALIQKCCESVHTTEISRALEPNFHITPPFVLPLAFLHAWKYCGFRVQTVKSCHPKHNRERAEFTI